MRVSALGPTLFLALAALTAPGQADAQNLAFDLQTRIPGLSPGDLNYVRGTRVLPHATSAIGFDIDAIHRPFVVTDPNLGTRLDVVETRSTFAIMYGVGLFEHFQATLAVPLVFQEGAGIEAFTGDPNDRLTAGAVADIRLDVSYSPLTEALRLGPVEFDFAFAGGILAPTGDDNAFVGSSAWSGYLDAMTSARWGIFRLALQGGLRFRDTATVLDTTWGSQALLAGGIALHLVEDRLVMAVEAQALLGLTDEGARPAQAMAEARIILDRSRTAIVFGFGGGMNGELGAPEWQVVAGFRHTPGNLGSPLARALSGEYLRERREE